MTVVGNLFLSLFPTPFALGGAYMLKRTYERNQHAAEVESTDPTAVGDLQPGDGPTVVEGTARAVGDERVEAPMLDSEGVYVYTQIEERSAREVGEQTGPAWETLYTESDAVPFVIDDGTGEIPVEKPERGVTKLDPEVFEAESGEEPPEPARRWLDGTDVDIEEEVDPHKAYKQGLIEDGETVYARGEPVSDGGDIVLTGDDHPDDFLLTDLAREELSEEESAGSLGYIVGLVLLAMGLVPLAFIWLV